MALSAAERQQRCREKRKNDPEKVEEVRRLQLRSIEEPAGGAGAGMPATTCYDAECARTEAWLDENQEFVHDYFLRKATRQVVDAWLVSHATPPSAELASPSRAGSGATTPVRKISAHEFERGGLLKPLVTTVDGTPTFLGDQPAHAAPSRPQRRSRHELRQLDEKELIFELVSLQKSQASYALCD
ncbi:hypothetical protein MSG28_013163 [Choristoneura fumiferana]|uniref:Uncharacterized protein n=1 Tax=Choristoneura fumiferana TaxID=7141 RepID=A0ACC0KS32_CHOFU|nr:hypothetical protein MSG28_013163 [Choristoneura fumiferana]